MIVPYMKSEIYSVDYNIEYEVYIVVDRKGEKIFSQTWGIAADAIQYAENHYKGLIDFMI